MLKELRISILMLLVLTVLTGLVYPLAMTGVAQLVFPSKANGSLIVREGKPVGSRLLGQNFDDPKYFWSRPSATAPFAYNTASSTGSNLGPLNPDLRKAVEARIKTLHESDPTNTAPIPMDLVTASASGLDPHISPEAAAYQIARVARARGMDPAALQKLVDQHSEWRTFGLLGEPVVNVLALNLALDGAAPIQKP